MHPFALYLAATDVERTDGARDEHNRRPRFAPVEALPLTESAPTSRLSRLTSVLRRRAARAASA